jgi:hypothetical protein
LLEEDIVPPKVTTEMPKMYVQVEASPVEEQVRWNGSTMAFVSEQ